MADISIWIAGIPIAGANLDEYSPILVSLTAEASSARDATGNLPSWSASIRFGGLRAKAGSYESRVAALCHQAVGLGSDILIRIGEDEDCVRRGSARPESPPRQSPPSLAEATGDGGEQRSSRCHGGTAGAFRVLDVLLNESLIATTQGSPSSTASLSLSAARLGPLPVGPRYMDPRIALERFNVAVLHVSGTIVRATTLDPPDRLPEDLGGSWGIACRDAIEIRFR